MTRVKRVAAAAGAIALSVALAACGDDANTAETGAAAESTADSAGRVSEDHNDADVTFAQQMIPHHAQALTMADMALQVAESADVRALAERIQAAQVPEIETMTTWLTEWGEEVPATSRDHSAGDDDGHGMTMDMPGMMTDDEMGQLEGSSGGPFDRMFLEMMIRHHEGAIEMAQTEQADGRHSEAIRLAQEIEESQAKEITEMQQMLQSV